MQHPKVKRVLLFVGAGAIMMASAGLGILTMLVIQVYFGDDSYLKRSAILAKINEETSIYYLDEKTKIGSFFDQQHRRYVPIDEIPPHMINALVASEDKYFYDHVGVNPIAIFKAIQEGFAEFAASGFRRLRFRGGSTITQQTVKNILSRREYSFSRKFREAVAALQLERLYSKREILEFYFNQFHVASNGTGIGIASQYYFNKDVKDLSLVEAAFIAGSVKAPNKYNPFSKYSAERRVEAQRYANERKNYVLRRMFEQSWISEEEFKTAYEEPVPFNKGKFTSREVALVALVRNQLNRKEITSALGIESAEELNYAGLRIYTSLDAELQQSAQLAMRRNLSRVETILQGFKAEDPTRFKSLRDLDVGEFYFGKVAGIKNRGSNPEIQINFGLASGVIREDALIRYAKLMDIAVPIGFQKRLKELLDAVRIGDVLFLEVKAYDPVTHMAEVELHKAPKVSGGLLALDKGEVRAVVSGFDPQGYNRAIFATRQPGSVFKSLAYFAALQLGWSILDNVDNERKLFPYQGQFYYPQPDHPSPYRSVSMLWSGIKSENLAAIHLNSKLVDKLNLDQFKAVLGVMDLLPKDGEAKRDYHFRVARALGVQLDNEGIREFELINAIDDAAPDLIFSNDMETLRELKRLWWGRGYVDELQRLYYEAEEDEMGENERALRIAMVRNNFQRLTILANQLEADWNTITQRLQEIPIDKALSDPQIGALFSRFRVIAGRSGKPELSYDRVLPEEEPRKHPKGDLPFVPGFTGRSLNGLDVQSIWGSGGLFTSSAGIELRHVRLNGYLPYGLFRKVAERLEVRYNNVLAIQEPYDLPLYFHHHDFRIAVGLNYVKKLCEAMGTFSKIEPVLSLPLGSNVVSLAEVAKIYQTFIDGKIYRFYKEGPDNQINIIRRVEDRDGNVLFEAKATEHQLVASDVSTSMRQILRKVVTHGTGSRARGELFIDIAKEGAPAGTKFLPIRIPAYGKTGTTNDYTTSSFAGFLPYPVKEKAPLTPSHSYTIAVYVGYDHNKTMVRGGFKVSGAFGALPVWTDFSKEIIAHKKYVDYLDKLDLRTITRQEWPLQPENGADLIKIDLPRGVILKSDDGTEAEIFQTTNISVTGEDFVNEFEMNADVSSVVRIPVSNRDGMLGPKRLVQPYKAWKNEDEQTSSKALEASKNFSPSVELDAQGKVKDGSDAPSKGAKAGNEERVIEAVLPPPTQPPANAVEPESQPKERRRDPGNEERRKVEGADSDYVEGELW